MQTSHIKRRFICGRFSRTDRKVMIYIQEQSAYEDRLQASLFIICCDCNWDLMSKMYKSCLASRKEKNLNQDTLLQGKRGSQQDHHLSERQLMITTKGLPTLTKLYQTVDIKFWHFLLHMILECGELKMQVLAAKYPEFTSRHHIPHAYNRREGWWQRSPKLLRQMPLGELAIPYLNMN